MHALSIAVLGALVAIYAGLVLMAGGSGTRQTAKSAVATMWLAFAATIVTAGVAGIAAHRGADASALIGFALAIGLAVTTAISADTANRRSKNERPK